MIQTMRRLFVRFLLLLLVLLVVTVTAEEAACLANGVATATNNHNNVKAPTMVVPTTWLPEKIRWESLSQKDVVACCLPDGDACGSDDADDKGPFLLKTTVIGKMPQFRTTHALQVLETAVAAWRGGAGVWPQTSLSDRAKAVRSFLHELAKSREEIVRALQWEIGKNRGDAEAEFDRTVQFGEKLLETLLTDPEFRGEWQEVEGTTALVRRHAIGVVLCLAPFNYPINESYAAILPALLLGNVVILKIPTTGGLAHLLTMQAFAKTLPAGTMNFISGSGRATMPPVMETGKIDALAFIGGSDAADKLIKSHPHPHRLKVFLQLEANNMGIFLDDLFDGTSAKELEHAVREAVTGSLSYNGQRCTALKLLWVPKAHADECAQKLAAAVEDLSIGPSWNEREGSSHPKITPLPTMKRVEYMQELVQDALSKGARILNDKGGTVLGGDESTLFVPAILYPVTPDMRVFHEEQFGPVVPISVYDDLEQVLAVGQDSPYAQQVSIFGHDPHQAATILDRFSAVFGKVNLNSQCGRSPDSLPFSGRRSSAMGVMSVKDALREFSVPTVVAHKSRELNDPLVSEMHRKSKFLEEVDYVATV